MHARPVADEDELPALAATHLAALVRAGESARRAGLAAHLRRIEAYDGQVRALVGPPPGRALRAARLLDQRRRRGETLGPLAGVPFVVKDNIDVRGQATSCGSLAHGGVLAVRHARAVQRLIAADAVLLGRTNMDEFAMGASTQTSAFGHTANPWDLRRSPGGSSGGSAAAVAAGFAAIALGTDTGGSIREPAAQCGVVGFAPSPGLVAMDGVVPFAPGFDRVGPLARTVGDCAAALRVLADLPGPTGGRLRVGVVTELCGARNQPAVLAGLARARRLLRDGGHDVIDVSMPDSSAALGAYMTLTSAACVDTVGAYVRTGRAGPEVRRRWALGQALRAGSDDLCDASAVAGRLTAQAAAALDRVDVLLSPTMPTTAPLLADVSLRDLTDPLLAPYTDCWAVVASLAGLPALAVPAGRSESDGMPVGVMIMSRSGGDADLLAIAGLLETEDSDVVSRRLADLRPAVAERSSDKSE